MMNMPFTILHSLLECPCVTSISYILSSLCTVRCRWWWLPYVWFFGTSEQCRLYKWQLYVLCL